MTPTPHHASVDVLATDAGQPPSGRMARWHVVEASEKSRLLVLVVDDDPYLLEATRCVFERAGNRVVTAVDGRGALAALTEAAPDLVVTDMRMPVMDGAELIGRLRSDPRTARLPVIALTGDGHLAGGADVVITKPCLPADLLTAAHQVLAARRAEHDASTAEPELDGHELPSDGAARAVARAVVADVRDPAPGRA